MANRKRAAHFLLVPELAGSPPNEAVVQALGELGYEVDLYAPGGRGRADGGASPAVFPAEYSRRWILKHALSPWWRRYALFSGTTEDPMALVGVLAWLHRRPSVTLADEIKRDAYRGNRPEWWKRLCRWAMRRSTLSVVLEAEQAELQREYAGLRPDHLVVVYPSCFRIPPGPGDRSQLRRDAAIPDDAIALVYSGVFGHSLGVEWMLVALDQISNLHVLAQLVNLDPLARALLRRTSGRERLHVEDRTGERRLSWREAWSSVVAGDIGMAVYHHSGSQWLRMGTSSNRLCMFLAMGIPVIVSRQTSFEFVEKYDCGVMVDSERGFVDAIRSIGQRLPEMKRNALRCAEEYIDAPGRYRALVVALGAVR